MDKPIISPDDYFAKISSLVRNFEMRGQCSVDHGWYVERRYAMSWNIRYAHGEDEDSRSTKIFMPKTFARLQENNPLASIKDHAAPWIADDNELLAVCAAQCDDTINIRLCGNGARYLVDTTYQKGSGGLYSFRKASWQEVLDECVAHALHHGRINFYQFECCSPSNKLRILDVLREQPIHNDETAQMFNVDLGNQLEGIGGQSRSRKM